MSKTPLALSVDHNIMITRLYIIHCTQVELLNGGGREKQQPCIASQIIPRSQVSECGGRYIRCMHQMLSMNNRKLEPDGHGQGINMRAKKLCTHYTDIIAS